MTHLSRLLLVAALAAWLAACGDDETYSQVMLVLDAESSIVGQVTTVEVTISGHGPSELMFKDPQAETFSPQADDWPLEIALVPKGQNSARRYRVEATAKNSDGNVLTVVRAESGYLENKVALLRLTFDAPCVLAARVCQDDETCSAGDCGSAVREPSTLTVYEPSVKSPTGGTDTTGGTTTTGGSGGMATGGVQSGGMVSSGGTTGGVISSGGAVATGGDEPPADPCANNGPCGDDQACVVEDGEPSCTPCPTGSTAPACGPRLNLLTVSGASLDREFDPDVTDYVLQVPLLRRQLDLPFNVRPGVTVTQDGSEVSDAVALRDLPFGDTTTTVRVTTPDSQTRDYRFTARRGGRQVHYLKASNADSNDYFGRSIAVSGTTVAVGAVQESSASQVVYQPTPYPPLGSSPDPRADNSVTGSGAVYIFKPDGQGAMTEVAYLKPQDAQPLGGFGSALAMDGNTLLVGAFMGGVDLPTEGGPFPNLAHGVAYVYVDEPTGYRQQQRLAPSAPVGRDWFGIAVDLQGDLAVVGAPDRRNGQVTVFERNGERWQEIQVIDQPELKDGGRFGASVHLNGEMLLVGAPGQPESSGITGDAYVFRRQSAGQFQLTHTLSPVTRKAGEQFGYAVAGRGNRVLVGAPETDVNPLTETERIGYVSVFDISTTTPVEVQRLAPPAGREFSLFGSSLEYTDQGVLFVGAQGEEDSGTGIGQPAGDKNSRASGGVYVFGEQGNRFIFDVYIKASNAEGEDNFGYVMDTSSELFVTTALAESSSARTVDGDQDDNGSDDSGAAYLFR